VLVVDNNSTDRTHEVVEGFCREFPGRFRYVLETKQGKSHALNSGIQHSDGEILAFMDDDVTANSNWLRNIILPIQSGCYEGVGGRILLDPSFTPPKWLGLEEPFNLGGVLAQFDLGDKPQDLDIAPVGTSMAFVREMFQKYGGFRTDLGPVPGSQIRGEDTEFGHRLLSLGKRLRYEPSAIVYHAVPEHRIQKGYFLEWYFDHGRDMVRQWERKPSFFGVPRPFLTLVKLLGTRLPLQVFDWLVTSKAKCRFFKKCWVWVSAGQICEIYRNLKTANENNWTQSNQ
jgi:glucosyl-dolichyl phosphate glucuronosyltransferase